MDISRSPLSTFEAQYLQSDQEHALLLDAQGALVVMRSGTANRVEFTPQELNRACMGTLSHNHPLGKPPSKDDLALAAQYGLTLRAFGTTPDGETYEYTVRMPAPSLQLAEQIDKAWDETLSAAQQELSLQALTDLQWEREARQLTVTRLAARYGFIYERTERHTQVSELAARETLRLDQFGAVNVVMRREVFAPLAASLSKLLLQTADGTGRVPLAALSHVRDRAALLVQETMLGVPQQNGALHPYVVQQDDQVIPRSAYFKALWGMFRTAAQTAVDYHAEMMRKYLPADLRQAFEFASLSPFDAQAVHEMGGPQYDPLHLWVGPDGKRLSDRIWTATGDMRRKLDAYLTEAIAAETPVQQIAQGLEGFLLPGKGGYEAMRLARAEVAVAYHRADSAAANLNPFVDKYSVFTAPSHQCCDECDLEEANSPYPKSDLSHLPIFHPECICGVVWHEVSDIAAVIIRLREQLKVAISGAKAAITDWIGPLSRRFTDLLFRGRAQ